jgi:multidrug efflux pump subunit AcrA (membrane-fusion protein)
MSRCSSRFAMPVRYRRRGFSVRGLIIVGAVLAGVGGVVYFTFPKLSLSSQDSGPMMHTVAMGDFVHDITERGNVESASNVDIRCEVESRGSQGTMILELIEEGTYVKPGDILCKLDSSSLEQEMVQQQIICNTSEAAVIQAQNNYDTAVIAKEEYLNGTYVENEQGIEGNIFVAEENLRRAEQTLAYTEKLFARGYVTQLAVDADEFSVMDSRKKLDEANTKKMVLQEYTKMKMLKQLEADIETTKAKLESEKHSHTLDEEKLADITAQVEKCTVVAPDYGQVVYANVTDRRGGSEIIIEEGGSIRERQVIFRLPDPNRMQVKAKINEASVSMVDQGMQAGIRLDAFPDLELKGDVEKVNEYPVPTSFFSGNVKEYETIIRIHLPGQDEDPPEGEEPKTDADTDDRSDAVEPDQGPETKPETTEDSPGEESDKAESSPEGRTEPKPSSGEDTDGEEESGEAKKDANPRAQDKTASTLLDESGNKVQLRPGMTAEVKIRVETIPNVLQVPVQAIVEHGGKNYCLMYDKATGWSKKEVKIGSTNDKMVVIEEGLEEGDKVVMGASKHREKVKWPKLETIPGAATAEQSAEGGPGRAPAAGGRSGRPGGGPAGGGQPNPAQVFKGLDKNSDGKLTEDEAPGPMKSNFASVDKNSDGSVDVAEFTAAMRAFSAGRGQGGAARGGAGGARPGGGGPGGGSPGGGAPGGGPRAGGAR